MNKSIKNFILEGEKEFEEKYDCIISDSQSDIYGDRISSFRSQQIKDFLYSRQISLIKIIMEMVEKMNEYHTDIGGRNVVFTDDYIRKEDIIRQLSNLRDEL